MRTHTIDLAYAREKARPQNGSFRRGQSLEVVLQSRLGVYADPDMRSRALGWVVASFFVVACEGAFTTPPEPGVGEGALPRCGEIGEPLNIEPATASVGEGQLFVLTGSGGTGVYSWSLSEDISGAEVDPNAGVYVAGRVLEDGMATEDVVLLEDRGCRGEASARISVVAAPRVVPNQLVLGTGESITFTGEAGSGNYTFELATDGSGGSVSMDGMYRAGLAIGRDVVRLTDVELGSTADAIIDVVADPSLRVVPAEWAIPVGSDIALPVMGGSGEFDVQVMGAGIDYVDGTTVRASAQGSATVTFTDRFISGRQVQVRVFSLAPEEASRRHDGDASSSHIVGATGDFDGDGFADVVVGMPFSDGERYDAGRVLIYRGTSSGLDTTPARVFSGVSRDEEFGMAIEVADLTGDGLDDLLIGSRRADPTRRDIGAVYVYEGVMGELFSETPVRNFFGVNSFDLFGDDIEVCDFNGDGLQDLAVSSPFGQDPDGETDQGVINVFLGYPGGRFISTPDIQIVGQVLSGGELVDLDRMRLGEQLASGDYDGDGNCDIAAYAIEPGEDMADTGAVYLFRGRPVDGPDRGGPELVPSLVWARADGTDDNNRFGEDLEMGDLDGDGRADIVAGRYPFDGMDGNDTGAIYVRRGREITGPATSITDIGAGADVMIEGRSGDVISQSLQLYDYDGDGDLDILSGDPRAQVMDGMISRPGMVRVYYGSGSLASVTPDVEIEGTTQDERFGLGMGPVADLDGDGRAEIVAFAPYYDTVEGEDDNRGALYYVSSGGTVAELDLLIAPSGQQVGRSVAWIGDLNGDGNPELAVGAQGTDITGSGNNLGAVRIYRGTNTGADSSPAQELVGFAGHSSGDEFGVIVDGIGDFDGDGIPDLGVLSRNDDAPTDPPMNWTQGCGRRDNPGTVYVFRGRADGTVEPEASYLYFGPFANQRFEQFEGGVDFNNDGLDDLIIGGREWDPGGLSNAGGVAVVFGRPAPMPGQVEVICAPDFQRDGTIEGERVGYWVTGLGDLDGDGCDEIAASTPFADPISRDEGGAIVIFGFDAMNCGMSTAPREVRLTGANRDSDAGTRMGGGTDMTGDGVPDLLIGAEQYRDGRGQVGRVYLVSGQYIVDTAMGSGTAPMLRQGSPMRLTVDGTYAGERLGFSLSSAPDPSGGSLAVLGGPFGASSGVADTGGAVVYSVGAMGFAADPRLVVAGESIGSGQLGYSVSASGAAGGRTVIAVGAPWSSLVSVDDGASYAFALTP